LATTQDHRSGVTVCLDLRMPLQQSSVLLEVYIKYLAIIYFHMKYMSENVACIILQHIIYKSNSIRGDTTYSHIMDISEHINHTVWIMLQHVTQDGSYHKM